MKGGESHLYKLPCLEYIEGPQDDLFPEILRDEPVARPRLYELGKNLDYHCFVVASIRAGNLIRTWMEDDGLTTSMRASKLKCNNNELFLVAL
ncbi:hypothetical protein LXL04_005531 [Taraxacum kok-saghyz]